MVKQRHPFAALTVLQRGSEKVKQRVPVLKLSLQKFSKKSKNAILSVKISALTHRKDLIDFGNVF